MKSLILDSNFMPRNLPADERSLIRVPCLVRSSENCLLDLIILGKANSRKPLVEKGQRRSNFYSMAAPNQRTKCHLGPYDDPRMPQQSLVCWQNFELSGLLKSGRTLIKAELTSYPSS